MVSYMCGIRIPADGKTPELYKGRPARRDQWVRRDQKEDQAQPVPPVHMEQPVRRDQLALQELPGQPGPKGVLE